jgi:hypothetical protein
MRTLLFVAVAVLPLASCYRDPATATTASPQNKQAPLSIAHDTDDELAFLPKESEIVVGLDLQVLRSSAAWRDQLEPALASSSAMAKSRQICGFDMFAQLTRVTFAARKQPTGPEEVEITAAGGDAQQQIQCMVKQLTSPYVTRTDGDTTIVTKPNDSLTIAVVPVGRSHIFAYGLPGADAAKVHAQLASGAPLRSSPAFMTLYDKLERGASLWFVLNGSSPLFQSLSLGVRPRYIDGTVVVSDNYVWTTRITMSSPNDASTLATTLRQVSAQAKQMVETFDIHEEADVVHVDIVLTQPQLQTILAMLGSFI